MAAVTRHLGFGVTANLSHEAPYLFARRMSTLDHLSRGRMGWNIVTGYLDSAARAMGQGSLAAHDRRYDQADEYLQVLYKLWEGSWADDAVVADRERRLYARPDRVRPVRHQGEFYKVEGYHLSEPSPQRTPVLFQAGASARGSRFAGEHAECVFIMGQDRESARKQVAAIRSAAEQAGRDPAAVKVFMGITVVVAATDQEARERHQEYLRYASPEAGLAHYAASTGIDLSRYGPDEPIRPQQTNAIESATKALTGSGDWTVRRILEQNALGGRYPALVGGPTSVTEQLLGWIDETGLDGFNLTRTVTPESYEDFIRWVIPELQSRGRYKTAYSDGSLRHKLFGAGERLPASHPGATYRFNE
jgi:FMN-dependent oxidoreductase (nitrilotriacetate monooxygenase family)